jgi:hypothetical protein
MREHARRAAGGRGHVEAVGAGARSRRRHDEAVLAQHEAVAAAAGLELGKALMYMRFRNSPHRGRRPRSCRASRRRTCRRSRASAAFARDRVVHRLRRACGKYQARFHRPTSSNFAPFSAAQSCIGVSRIGSNRSPREAGESAESHRRIGRAEGRQADLGDRLAERGGGDGERVHVRGLALVGRHAGRGVALDVLDRAHALAHRELMSLAVTSFWKSTNALARSGCAGAAATRPSARNCPGAPSRRARRARAP